MGLTKLKEDCYLCCTSTANLILLMLPTICLDVVLQEIALASKDDLNIYLSHTELRIECVNLSNYLTIHSYSKAWQRVVDSTDWNIKSIGNQCKTRPSNSQCRQGLVSAADSWIGGRQFYPSLCCVSHRGWSERRGVISVIFTDQEGLSFPPSYPEKKTWTEVVSPLLGQRGWKVETLF